MSSLPRLQPPASSSSSTRLFSPARVTTLLVSVLVSLCSGTNYVYSAYGPQLGVRLGLTHTQQNLVGLGGNAGSYSTSALHGRLVDARGPRLSLVIAFFTLFTGYLGTKIIFDVGLKENQQRASTATVILLIVCGFLTGNGGCGGSVGTLNTVAKSFPDHLRTSFIGLLLSGFGLSAFLFSAIAHSFFPGNTSDFLLVLAIGTSLPMILGYFFVRPIPLPAPDGVNTLEDAVPATRPTSTRKSYFGRGDGSRARLLPDNELDRNNKTYVQPPRQRARTVSIASCGEVGVGALSKNELPDISGKELFMSSRFWLLFSIESLLSGVGLMWINNVGLVAQALYTKGTPVYDEVESFKFQTLQVSVVSVMNCVGKISIGLFTDFVRSRVGIPRSWCISLVAMSFFISQLVAMSIVDVKELWKASFLVGFSHGAMFGLFPAVTIDWFGMPHFSQNWGFVTLSPLIGGNLFSMAFGKNIDNHASRLDKPNLSPTSPNTTILARCMDGAECYIWSLKLTTWACVLAFGLAVLAGYRDWEERTEREKRREYRPVLDNDS